MENLHIIFQIGVYAVIVWATFNAAIMLGKFFVVKSLARMYNDLFKRTSYCAITFVCMFGAAVVLISVLTAGLDSTGTRLGLVYFLFGCVGYITIMFAYILDLIIPKLKAFHDELERKRG